MEHHDRAVAAFVRRVASDPAAIAVVVTGSVGRGTERVDSDVDLYLIVSEDAWLRAIAADRIAWTETEGIGFEAGYFDIKLATIASLRDAGERGDDPVRASLRDSRVAWTRDPLVAHLLERAGERSAAAWHDLERSFAAQASLHGGYFLLQAERRNDPILLHHAAVHLAVSAARAVLAHGRVLYPGPKDLRTALGDVPGLGAALLPMLDRLVTQPAADVGAQVLEFVQDRLGIVLPTDEALSTFIRDNELAWMTRVPPPEFR